MRHHVATVEIEFDHDEAADASALLRRHLEAMLEIMRDSDVIGEPHYHLLPRYAANAEEH